MKYVIRKSKIKCFMHGLKENFLERCFTSIKNLSFFKGDNLKIYLMIG